MKTYRKPNSVVIEIDSEDIMQVMKASGVVEGATPGTSSSETNLGFGGEAGNGMTAHGKESLDAWE